MIEALQGFQNVLFLGAHPDDEMGCAGTLYELSQRGARIRVVTFSRCDDLNDAILILEWQEALAVLGIESQSAHLLSLPNRRLPEHRQAVLDALDIERHNGAGGGPPDLVLCPMTTDAHQDHCTVAMEAKRAFKDTTVLGYDLPMNHVNSQRLDAYVGLSSAAVVAKLEHAAIYRSQRDKPYMDASFIEGLARVRGVQSGRRYAEAFEVIRWVM